MQQVTLYIANRAFGGLGKFGAIYKFRQSFVLDFGIRNYYRIFV